MGNFLDDTDTPAPTVVTEVDDPEVAERARQKALLDRQREGRRSTILTEDDEEALGVPTILG